MQHAEPADPRRQDLPYLVRALWNHLTPRRRRQVILLSGLMLLSALAEVVSLGAILPFLGALMDPKGVYAHPVIQPIAAALGIGSPEELIFPITVLFIAATLVASAIRMMLLWASTRLGFAAGADLGIAVYGHTLHQPYSEHLEKNSSDVISGILHKVNGTVFGVLLPMLTLISSSLMLVAILAALIAIHPLVASVSALGFGGSYALISWRARKHLQQTSRDIVEEQTRIIKALQEGLGGIRDVLLDGTQAYYCDLYRRADQNFRRAQAGNTFISLSPRYLIEAVGIVLIACLTYGLSRSASGVASAMPVLGALALGAQRLLPALQQVYHSWASITGNHAALSDTIELLDQASARTSAEVPAQPVVFRQGIALRGVHFRYARSPQWVLQDINLEIPKGARVGIVGTTGSGKSTLMDLLMGLLSPTQGAVHVDGAPLAESQLPSWQRLVAHVPQSIYLADGTIAENIAFGVAREAIDMERVKESARQARLSDFIETRPQGFNERVGERGIRLSGGQRQRIAIARALYKRKSVLFFDEATSALDYETEKSVMEAVNGLDRELTVIMVAHRLSSLQHCDFIVELEKGRLSQAGSYAQLVDRTAHSV